MLQISQPFSFPGPTRMSQKRNLSGLSVLAGKACNKSTPTSIDPVLLRGASALCFGVMALAKSFVEPQHLWFNPDRIMI